MKLENNFSETVAFMSFVFQMNRSKPTWKTYFKKSGKR